MSYNSDLRLPQGGKDLEVNTDRNGGGKAALSLTMTAAAGGANQADVTIQVANAAGEALAGVFCLFAYYSDSATGIGVTATSPSGAITVETGGTLQTGAIAGFRFTTDATGKAVIRVTDTANTLYTLACLIGLTGRVGVVTLTASDYGS